MVKKASCNATAPNILFRETAHTQQEQNDEAKFMQNLIHNRKHSVDYPRKCTTMATGLG